MDARQEWDAKRTTLAAFLDRHQLDGVLLTQRPNFSWVTCGKYNYIANNATGGVATILATADERICLASTIESPRMIDEELKGTGIETRSFPWYDPAAATRAATDAIAGRKIATDSEDFGLGLPALPGDFAELRWSLTAGEIERYRKAGRLASAAMEKACRAIQPGWTEREVAGRLDCEVHNAGLNPLVTLVAGDHRISAFRHPIPTLHRVKEQVMLVTCCESGGLISCLTRFVRFGRIPEEVAKRHKSVLRVEAVVNGATKAGKTLGEIFTDLQAAYAAVGQGEQWKLHHQGGSTGYANREVVAIPGSGVKVVARQAFAWNPSITGAKSEDTILVTDAGYEVLTPASDHWPKVPVPDPASPSKILARPDILMR